jgi:hypothetical protein
MRDLGLCLGALASNKQMTVSDRQHLKHAQGWLGLGNWPEADKDLDSITPEMQGHPDVLRVRFGVHEKTNNWEMAYETASVLCQNSESHWNDVYNLARAACRLGRLKEAFDAVRRAFDLAGTVDIRPKALADEALQGVWADIREI